MATTTSLKDFLGRWLSNGTPGTTNATDHLGRNVAAGSKDFIGRSLTFTNPAAWVTATAYSVGAHARLTGGALVQATTAGTSGATEPAAPASVGGTVADNTVTWKRVK